MKPKRVYVGHPIAEGTEPVEIIDPPPEHLFLTERDNGEVYLHFQTMDAKHEYQVNVSSIGSDELPGAREFIRTWVREFREGLYSQPTARL